jgi:hypothetical protein
MLFGALLEGAILLWRSISVHTSPGVNNSEKKVIEGLSFSAL